MATPLPASRRLSLSHHRPARLLRPSFGRALALLAFGAGAWGVKRLFDHASAVHTPPGLPVVHGFDVHRFMGYWYEVARIESSYERGLVYTSTNYTLRPDGTIKVFNRGYDPVTAHWKEAVGQARFQHEKECGALKVAFRPPFFNAFHVVAVDPDYHWAMVVGSDLDEFWILSRTALLPDRVRESLLEYAAALGVDLCKVLWIPQGIGMEGDAAELGTPRPQPAKDCT